MSGWHLWFFEGGHFRGDCCQRKGLLKKQAVRKQVSEKFSKILWDEKCIRQFSMCTYSQSFCVRSAMEHNFHNAH